MKHSLNTIVRAELDSNEQNFIDSQLIGHIRNAT